MNGLFVGLATLDLIYLIETFPDSNEKIVALEQCIAAGGPATNAAVTFGCLGDSPVLLTVVGEHAIADLIRSDLALYSVQIVDLKDSRQESPPVSSILVTKGTGERAVISLNGAKFQATPERLPRDILCQIDLVLIDGHQMSVSQAIVREAEEKRIPVVLDGGSWKPGLEQVLPWVDYGICSANFYPPNCRDRQDVLAYLQEQGISHIAITQGEKPIEYFSEAGLGQVEVPSVQAIDTLGAGDIFHGAFCHYILRNNFAEALAAAARVAALSCQYFGPRQWMLTSSPPSPRGVSARRNRTPPTT